MTNKGFDVKEFLGASHCGALLTPPSEGDATHDMRGRRQWRGQTAPTMKTRREKSRRQGLSPGGLSFGDPGGSRLHIREPALVWPMTRWSSNSAKDGRSSMRTTREGARRVAASTARAAQFERVEPW
jgi:hypothetical protein